MRWQAVTVVAACIAMPALAGLASNPPSARAAIDAGTGTTAGLDQCGELFTTTILASGFAIHP